MVGWWVLIGIGVLLVAVVIYDLTQKKHAILRNFPVIGHFRYLFEAIGPELRQYIVTSNDEERPFSRDQRRWVYSSAKKQNNYFGFGTDNDLEASAGTLIMRHAAFPITDPQDGDANYDELQLIPCAKVWGAAHGRKKAYRPASVVYISAMSFGSLSSRAVEALNAGAGISHVLHNTGEGGIAPYHDRGGDLIWQLGTGYYGCRDDNGRFDIEILAAKCEKHRVRAVEIKLSQGAKPGRGGVLPAAKVTDEISKIRGIPVGKDCISPASHNEFSDVDGLIDFVETIAERTGLPVGIKSAVGDLRFWEQLANRMKETQRGPDFIQIDGGEGGTGAAPLVFSDHVALPFKLGMSSVFRFFEDAGIAEDVVFVGSGRLGFPLEAVFAMAMGCDMVALAREPMMAIGCIQAQRCHTGHCPAGVATQDRWLMRGLDPADKAARLANYMVILRKEMLWLARACGFNHPASMSFEDFAVLGEGFKAESPRDVFDYAEGWGVLSEARLAHAEALMRGGPEGILAEVESPTNL